MISEFRCKEIFLSLRYHFTTPNYDYFKFKGRLKSQPSKASTHFKKISNKFNNSDAVEEFFVMSMTDYIQSEMRIPTFIGEYLNFDLGHWKYRRQNLSRNIKNYFIDKNNLKSFIVPKDGTIKVLDDYISSAINIEIVVAVMDAYPSVVPLWERAMSGDPLRSTAIKILKKFIPFYKKYFNREKVVDEFVKM